ncbi:hypothetical protein BGZ58_001539 [Dissophora ornata]|nr:hypothetical protein BGZ58_001539 [Dissophora ornata]
MQFNTPSNPFNAAHALGLMQAALASSFQVNDSTLLQQQQQIRLASQQIRLASQQQPMMEDDTADPPSPPAISSDDMDMEASLLDDTPSPASGIAPRQDAQTQCDEDADRNGDNLPFIIDDHDDPLQNQQ